MKDTSIKNLLFFINLDKLALKANILHIIEREHAIK